MWAEKMKTWLWCPWSLLLKLWVLALGWGQFKKMFTSLYISCTCGGRGGGLKENDYIIMFTWKFPSKIVNVMFPCVSVLTLRQGQIGSVVFKHMYTIIFWKFLSMRHICKRYWFHNFLKQESIFLNFKSHVF